MEICLWCEDNQGWCPEARLGFEEGQEDLMLTPATFHTSPALPCEGTPVPDKQNWLSTLVAPFPITFGEEECGAKTIRGFEGKKIWC